MTIRTVDRDHIIIDTPQGSVHVGVELTSKKGTTTSVTKIYWNDHASITLFGSHKKEPTIFVDSEEYPTNIVVKEPEGPWLTKEFPE